MVSMKTIKNTGSVLLAGPTVGNTWASGSRASNMEEVSTICPTRAGKSVNGSRANGSNGFNKISENMFVTNKMMIQSIIEVFFRLFYCS